MRKRSFLLVGLCLLISLTGYSQTKSSKIDLNQEIKLESTVRYGKLDNGMTYYIKANKKPENRADFYLAVNAGSVLETEDQRGLAHFTEHMGFNGTKQFPGNTLTDELSKNGITFGRDDNAYTAFDQTVYQLTLPTDKPELFNLGLKVLDGWASGMLMAGTEIDAERGVIIEEWRGNRGAQERMRAKIWPIILKGSKYADRLPIGTLDNLQNFKYSSIRNFYKTWYRPDNQAVIIVGDFDADEMEQKVKDFFTMTPKPCEPLVRPTESIPDNKEPLIAVATDKEATSTQIMLFYKHPAQQMRTVGDFRNQELLVNLYELMLSNRLNEKSDKKDCPFLGASAGYAPSFIARTVGGYISSAAAKDGKALESLKAMVQENERVLRYGFLQTEFDRAKESLLERYEQSAKEANKTHNTVFSSAFVDNFLEGTPAPGARQEYRWAKALMKDITLEEVNALAKNWITKENIVCYITMPEGKKIPTEKDILKILDNASSMKVTPYVDTYKEVPFFSEKVNKGKIVSEKKNEKFDYTELKLSNGATVILKPTTLKDNEIIMNCFSKGGESLYGDADVFNAQMAASIIDGSGIGQMDHNQLQKFQQKHSFGTEPYIGDLSEGISGNCAPKDFELLMQYFYMYFTAPAKDKEVLETKVAQLKSQLPLLQNSPDIAFAKQLRKSMYPNDKRNIVVPTDKDLNSLNIDKMYKIFRERFSSASDFTFVIVGTFGVDTTKALIEKYIASLPTTGKTEQWKDVSPQFAKGKVDDKVYKGTEDKATMCILIKKPFNYTDKEKRIIDVMGEILQIRCTEKIREELGSTYSPYLGIAYSKYPKAEFTLQAYYSIQPSNEQKVTDATFAILDEMIQNGASEDYIAKAKEQLIKRREQAMQSNNFWSNNLQSLYLYGNEILDVDTYNNSINAVTNDDLKASAAKYLKYDEHVKVTLLPEQTK